MSILSRIEFKKKEILQASLQQQQINEKLNESSDFLNVSMSNKMYQDELLNNSMKYEN